MNNYQMGNNRGYDHSRSSGRPNQTPAATDTRPMQLSEDYVQEAENIMKIQHYVTTTKLRSILSLVTEIYNVENIRTDETLLQDSVEKIQMMRVRILYEAGRDNNVRQFIDDSHLINYIKGIGGSRKNFIAFARYMEALVAYHRYFGGRE